MQLSVLISKGEDWGEACNPKEWKKRGDVKHDRRTSRRDSADEDTEPWKGRMSIGLGPTMLRQMMPNKAASLRSWKGGRP